MNTVLFNTLEINNKKLMDCELVYRDQHDNIRMYLDKDKYSFYCMAVTFNTADVCENYWEHDSLEVNILFRLIAYGDGARHMHFGDFDPKERGYLYYPPIRDMTEMFKIITEVEVSHLNLK